ncbi:NUDIX hydrolase [Thermicanus aegyptius]|uniref:NUDIX hydrolase n=1 Tax=Thermicanus aegyptius TaxID=94009 RepID=UPI000408D011|nr:hypothetical protein [Thermicanus aegyptius]
MERIITRLSREIVYKDKYLTLNKDQVKFPDGRIGSYVSVEHTQKTPSGLVGVATLGFVEDKIITIKIFRYPIGEFSKEIPRGFVKKKRRIGERSGNSGNCGRSEVGKMPYSCTLLGYVYPDTGIFSGKVGIFMANFNGDDFKGDEKEGIAKVELNSTEEILSDILTGKIQDSYTLAAITFALANGVLVDISRHHVGGLLPR